MMNFLNLSKLLNTILYYINVYDVTEGLFVLACLHDTSCYEIYTLLFPVTD